MTKKKILMIVVPIVAVVLIGIIFAILFFATDIFKSDEEQFWTYMAQNKDITKVLENDKLAFQTDYKSRNSYNSTGNFSFSLTQGSDSSKTFNVATTARHDITNGRTYADATLKNGDINLFNVSFIKCADQTNGDIYAIKSSDVLDTYVGFRNAGLKQLAAKYNISTDVVPDTIVMDDYSNVFELTDEQKQHIYETYIPIIQNSISKDNYAKTNQDVQIDGETYNANVYAVQFTGDQLKQIIIDCLNALKSDTETMVMLSNKASTLNMGVEYTDMTNLTMKINNIIETINSADFSNNTTTIYVYENYDETIRTVVDIENLVKITYDRLSGKQILTIDYTQGAIEKITSSTNQNNMQTSNELENNVDGNMTTVDETSEITTNESNRVSENLVSEENTTEDQTEENIADEENQILDDATNTETSNVIDLNATTTTEDESSQEVSRLVITKITNEQNTSNNITFIPNINSEYTNNISLTYDMSAVTNNTMNNAYNITLTTNNQTTSSTTTIDFTTNTVATSQVEPIQELNDSNTVIANNYDANQFTTFITQWMEAFKQVLDEKMATIGIEGNEAIVVQQEDGQQTEQNGVDTTDQ